MTPRSFKKVESDFVKIGEGEGEVNSVEGVLMEKSSQSFTKGVNTSIVGRYTIQPEPTKDNPEPLPMSFLGSTDMDAKLAQVGEGSYIRITFVGTTRTNNGQTLNKFDVEVAEN